MKSISLQNAMTPNPVCIAPSTSIVDAMEVLNTNHFDHLPVTTGDKRLVGIVSRTDVFKKVLALTFNTSGKTYNKKVLNSATVEEIMTTETISLDKSAPLKDAVGLLLKGTFHALPILDSGTVVGIITTKDILEVARKTVLLE